MKKYEHLIEYLLFVADTHYVNDLLDERIFWETLNDRNIDEEYKRMLRLARRDYLEYVRSKK